MRGGVTARYLRAIRDRKWSVVGALAELLDNAFGERRGNASTVIIRWNAKKRLLGILDDGQGMKDIVDLFIFGQGERGAEGDIGLYGSGGSEALVWLSDATHVATLRESRVAQTTTNYADCIATEKFPDVNHRWRNATAINCPLELLNIGHGTLLVLHVRPDLRILPEFIQDRLSRLFGVGLRNGRRIRWMTDHHDGSETDIELHPWNPGTVEDRIETTVTIASGLSARVRAGRVDDLSIANSTLSVNFLYRQVKETRAGFGRPVQGAVGDIDLAPAWLQCLTTTKDDIREDCRHLEDQLMVEVARVLEPLIEQLRRAKLRKVFRNVKINLRFRFKQGFDALAHGSSHSGRGGGIYPSPPGPHPNPPRPHRAIHAAQIDIEEAFNDHIGGLLCKVEMTGKEAIAFVNVDHPIVVMALEAEPVNQVLLENLLVTALAKEIVEKNALVTWGVLSELEAARLMERYDGNTLDVVLYIIRVLTDGLVEAA